MCFHVNWFLFCTCISAERERERAASREVERKQSKRTRAVCRPRIFSSFISTHSRRIAGRSHKTIFKSSRMCKLHLWLIKMIAHSMYCTYVYLCSAEIFCVPLCIVSRLAGFSLWLTNCVRLSFISGVSRNNFCFWELFCKFECASLCACGACMCLCANILCLESMLPSRLFLYKITYRNNML